MLSPMLQSIVKIMRTTTRMAMFTDQTYVRTYPVDGR